MISRTMSKIETNVLNLIINHATFEEPIKAERSDKKLDYQSEVWKK